jgi:pimeloyl-ACP methyl ester carboxylesterase
MESRQLNDNSRGAMGGSFVRLPDGVVHYELKGPEDSQPVVMIHGFSEYSYSWDQNYNRLVEEDFRVIRYDAFGRGFSDRPALNYTPSVFINQIFDLLNALNITKPVDLVGFSLGGLVAVWFTATHPDLVRKLTLVSPAGLINKIPSTVKPLMVPVLGSLIWNAVAGKLLLSGVTRDFSQPEKFKHLEAVFKKQMKFKGYKRSLLSTLRNVIKENNVEYFDQLRSADKAVLLVWGREDTVNPFSNHEAVCKALPAAEFVPIQQAGHACHHEKSEIFNRVLINFLSDS